MGMLLSIEEVKQRYWWPHPIYREARRNGYNCFKPWRPYVDVVVSFRYFVNGVETNLYGTMEST